MDLGNFRIAELLHQEMPIKYSCCFCAACIGSLVLSDLLAGLLYDAEAKTQGSWLITFVIDWALWDEEPIAKWYQTGLAILPQLSNEHPLVQYELQLPSNTLGLLSETEMKHDLAISGMYSWCSKSLIENMFVPVVQLGYSQAKKIAGQVEVYAWDQTVLEPAWHVWWPSNESLGLEHGIFMDERWWKLTKQSSGSTESKDRFLESFNCQVTFTVTACCNMLAVLSIVAVAIRSRNTWRGSGLDGQGLRVSPKLIFQPFLYNPSPFRNR